MKEGHSMVSGARWSRRGPGLALVLALTAGAVGCRTSSADIEHWATTVNGPGKLVAVLSHDKYSPELRAEAALALVRMKPRGGRRVGIELLTDTLATVKPDESADVVARITPVLLAEMKKLPERKDPNTAPIDPTVAYKDAAYALLTRSDGTLVRDDKVKAEVREALAAWAAAAFAERLDDSTQMFSMEQVLRTLGAPGVRALPTLIVFGGKKLERICDLVADLGDPATKLQASERLVDVAKKTDGQAYLDQLKPTVEAANKASGFKNVTPDMLAKQLDAAQAEELTRLFGSMKKLGGAPAIDYLLGYAAQPVPADDKREFGKRVALALVALEGKIDAKNQKQVGQILAIATAKDTADVVRDQALRRVGELPRELVAEKLYGMFSADFWKLRWVSADLLLRLSDTSHLDEFMQRIGRVGDMAVSEPLSYGALVSKMKQGKGAGTALDISQKYVSGAPTPARLVALGYWYEVGTAADLGKVEPYASESTKVPGCKKDAKECEWKCTIVVGGKPEPKEVTTVGEYVSYCVKPAMEKRAAAAPQKK
jgi:hypothetical protein